MRKVPYTDSHLRFETLEQFSDKLLGELLQTTPEEQQRIMRAMDWDQGAWDIVVTLLAKLRRKSEEIRGTLNKTNGQPRRLPY